MSKRLYPDNVTLPKVSLRSPYNVSPTFSVDSLVSAKLYLSFSRADDTVHPLPRTDVTPGSGRTNPYSPSLFTVADIFTSSHSRYENRYPREVSASLSIQAPVLSVHTTDFESSLLFTSPDRSDFPTLPSRLSLTPEMEKAPSVALTASTEKSSLCVPQDPFFMREVRSSSP